MNHSITQLRFGVLLLIALRLAPGLSAFPKEMVTQGIKGPWELSISLGVQESGVVFPFELSDEDTPQTLNQSFPVPGTPLQIKLQQYCPDLTWKTNVTADPQGGPVASITVAGNGARQEVVLLADVPERRSVTASIGGLAIRRFYQASTARTLLEQIAAEKAAGLLTVWTGSDTPPLEFAVKTGLSFSIPGTSYKAEILEYMPHYSIDSKSKAVHNYSEQPVNPAIKIRLSDEHNTYEQWLWSNFAASPHMISKLPLRVEFNDFDTGPAQMRYFIVTAGDSELWLYYRNTEGIQLEKARENHPYPFKDAAYTFTLDSLLPHGSLSRTWGNGSGKLQHPALVVSVESDKGTHEAVVELNKPAHVETSYGTLVLQYRQKTDRKQHGTL